MPQPCSICTHAERPAIDAALVGDAPNRRVASRFAVSEAAVRRHKADHLPDSLREAAHEQQRSDAIDVMEELTRCFRRVNLLLDACDRWLRDPDDPNQYDIGPRSTDVMVVYSLVGPDGKVQRKKAALSELLGRLQDEPYLVERWEYKHADPRELILKAASQLSSQLELVAKLLGKLQPEGTTNITINTAWIEIRGVLLHALAPFPEARAAVAAALLEVDHAAG